MEDPPPLKVQIRLRLPAIFVRVWSNDTNWLHEALRDLAAQTRAVQAVRPGLLAVLPTAADPNVVEAASWITKRLVLQAPDGAKVSALAVPGRLRGTHDPLSQTEDLGAPTVLDNIVLEDIEHHPPTLEPGRLHLTSHAAYQLESPWHLAISGHYRSPSGREVPVTHLDRPGYQHPPWRNPELLGRVQQWTQRTEVEEDLRQRFHHPVTLLTGPLGCGKTRLATTVLEDLGTLLRIVPWSARSGGPSLAKQIVLGMQRLIAEGARSLEHPDLLKPVIDDPWWSTESDDAEAQLREIALGALRRDFDRPLILMVDSLEALSTAEQGFVEELSTLPGDSSSLNLLLIGRSGGDWAVPFSAPRIAMPPMSRDEVVRLAPNLIDSLSMPERVSQRLLSQSTGHVWSLEEAMVEMVRRKEIRQVYGSFFFSGDEETQPEASLRLVCHLESECARLKHSVPLRLLGVSPEATIPIDEITGAALTLDPTASDQWVVAASEAGLVATHVENLHEVARFTVPLHAQAIRHTLDESSERPVRQLLGRELAGSQLEDSEAWQAYQLLAGTPEGIPLLLRSARRSGTNPEELFLALTRELQTIQDQEDDEKVELALLWALLPIARRLGRLSQIRGALLRSLELTKNAPEKYVALISLRAELEQNEGRLRDAEATILEGLEIGRNSDKRRRAMLFLQLGKVLQRQERFSEARKLFEETLPVLERSGDETLIGNCHFHLGNLAIHENRVSAAIKHHERALDLRRNNSQLQQVGASMTALGTSYLASGHYPRALESFREAKTTLSRYSGERDVAFALIGEGRAYTRLGDYTSASQPFRRALSIRKERDDRAGEAIARLFVARNHMNLGQLERALTEARQAHFQLSLIEGTKQLAEAEQVLGRIRLAQREHEEAGQHLEAALRRHQDQGDVINAAFDRAYLLEASLGLSDHRRIEELCMALDTVLDTLHYPEQGEVLDLRLYQGLDWLRHRGRDLDPLKPLERGYRELYRKTELLSAELRNPFLFQVPDNRAIINAATQHGISLAT